MVYGTYNYSIHWVYKPSNITIVICTITGWWLEHEWIMTFHSVGNVMSSQLTNSYFSEGQVYHQPVQALGYFYAAILITIQKSTVLLPRQNHTIQERQYGNTASQTTLKTRVDTTTAIASNKGRHRQWCTAQRGYQQDGYLGAWNLDHFLFSRL